MFVNPDGQPALVPSGLIQACFLGKSCDFTIWLIDTMNLLSAMGSYMLSTTHALSHQLSPASRYLRPSSYLRHALLLGFSSSPSYISTHSVVFDMYIFFYLPFCSCKSCILDILSSLFVDLCHLLLLCFYLCSYLFGQTAGQLITHRYRLSWSPSSYSFEFLFFCCIPHSASLSMGCTANPKCVLKKQSAHSELQKAAIFFFPLHREMLQRASPLLCKEI